jgi:nucleoside-diphosphate kinase
MKAGAAKIAKVSGFALAPAPGAICKQFGTSLQENAIHGSDSPESAAFECGFMFSRLEQL